MRDRRGRGGVPGVLRRIVVWLVVAALLLPGWLLRPSPTAAYGTGLLNWAGGTTFATFGANDTIIIELGQINYVKDCLVGQRDYIYPAADIYVVLAEKLPTVVASGDIKASSVTKHPNATVTAFSDGTFTDTIIGFTKPAGATPRGTYAVIYDQCQDGILGPEDAVFSPTPGYPDEATDQAGFTVDYDSSVPLPPGDHITAIKDNARNQALAWQATKVVYDRTQKTIMDNIGAIESLHGPASRWYYGLIDQIAEQHNVKLSDIGSQALANQYSKYNALYNDPPDPDFKQISPLDPRGVVDPGHPDPIIRALSLVGASASNESALTDALIHSIERYDGARLAGDGDWALIHARAIQLYARALATQLGATNGTLDAWIAALNADTSDLDGANAEFVAFLDQLATSGFTAEELQAARNMGFSDSRINALKAYLLGLGLDTATGGPADSEAATITHLQGLQATNQSAITDMNDLANAMDAVIAALLADESVEDRAPVADAGGPYSGAAGTPVAFAGSATTAESVVTSYEWDLDGDGQFDDAFGAAPTFTYGQNVTGLVGLRVTNDGGFQAVDYAPIAITGGNQPPTLTAPTPGSILAISVGASQAFTITTSDPDEDPVDVRWVLDGAQVGTGTTFTYIPPGRALGTHTLQALATNPNVAGGATVRATWTVTVRHPDEDGDGWWTNVDCDDNDTSTGYCPVAPPATTLTVTSTGDSASCPDGPGQPGYTLRCAINDANSAGSGMTIAFNIPPTDLACDGNGVCVILPTAGGTTLPTLTASDTVIDGYTQPGAAPNTNGPGQGTNAVIKINLRGERDTTGRVSLWIAGNSNTLRGLSMTHFTWNNSIGTYGYGGALWVSGNNNRLVGNYIGPLPDATLPDRKNMSGIEIVGDYNIVGGTNPADMNLLSGNSSGVNIHNTNGSSGPYPTGNVVIGNLIGTDPTGTIPFANSAINNQGVGVRLNTARNTVIGGTTPAERNIISGNRSFGLDISSGVGDLIVGNYIGPDITGAVRIGNSVPNGNSGSDCCGIRTGVNTQLVIKGNVISGNGDGNSGAGMQIDRCDSCRIIGNKIGTNAAGTAAMGNSQEGVRIIGGTGWIIGGTGPGEGNLISGNGRNGIWLSAEGGGYSANDQRLIGNLIGTDVTGAVPIGNGAFGIWSYSASYFATNNIADIGGIAPGEGNVIANNGRGGIGLGTFFPFFSNDRGLLPRDLIRGNVFRNNGGFGIELQPEGVVNCAEATTNGPNAYIHCPVIRSVSGSAVSGTGPAGSTIDVYLVGAAGDESGHGEASVYLGSTTTGGCGNGWILSGLDLPPGAVVTATASNLSGENRGTSEFAANVAVGTNLPLIAPNYTPATGQNVVAGTDVSVQLGSFAESCVGGPWSVSVNWDDGTTASTFQMPVVGDLGALAHRWSHGGTYYVTVTVTDSEGATDTGLFTVTVGATVPDAPTGVAATPGNASATVAWDPPFTNGGSPVDSYTVSIVPTAGGTPQTRQITDLVALTTTFTDLTNGTQYTASVSAHNANGDGVATSTTVTPVGPVISLTTLGTTTLPEGSAAFGLTVTGTGFADGMTVRWDGTGRATTFVSATELSAQITATDLENSGSASVTVYDTSNTATSNALAFTITNVAPSATFSTPDPVVVGSSFTLALTGATDPSTADTTAGFTYAFDCGSGYGAFSPSNSVSCPTSATGSSTVKGKLHDQDGGEREYTATVEVVDLPAATLAVATASGPYNGTATLSATLTLDGTPLVGRTVSFTLNGNTVGSATTGNDGVATLPGASLAGIAAGLYPSGVSATYDDTGGQHLGDTGTAALAVAKANQTITFAALGDRVFGSGTFAVSATSSSGLPVTFLADGGNCTVAGTTVTLVALGTCTIVANQHGNDNYSPASNVARSFQILAPATGLTAVAATGTYGGTATLTATLLDDDDQPLVGKTIAFSLGGTAVGSVTTDTNGLATLPNISMAGFAAGTYPAAIGASFAGDADFAASSDTADLTVEPATLTITANNASRQYGVANPTFLASYDGFVSGDTPDDLTGTVVCTSAANWTSAPGTYPINCAGLTADNYTIVYVAGTLTVTKAGQAITFAALAARQLAASPFGVAATASSGLTVAFTAAGACTVSGTAVTLTGIGTCTVTANQGGNGNYNAAPAVSRSFQVTANPPAGVTLTLTTQGGGAVLVAPPGTSSAGGTFSFAPGARVSLTPQPGNGQTFVRWLVDGVNTGWAPELTLTMDGPHIVTALYEATPTFPDVPGTRADAQAILALAARGYIRGYLDGTYGPGDTVQRAQMAALIARATPLGPGTPPATLVTPGCLVVGTWDCEDWGNGFQDQNGLNTDLWRNVGTLQHYGVAKGYDGDACKRRGVPSPCYAPTAPVSYVETITFITRAMIAKGYWQAQPGAAQPYAGVPAVFATEVATFRYYAGDIPAPPDNWNAGATRGWFAQALWAALDSYWGNDGQLADGRNAGGFAP